MSIKTPLCDLLGCRYPIMNSGMDGHVGKELAVAVTLAGGFGVFAPSLANIGPEELLAQIKEVKRLCQGKPFGIGLATLAVADPEGSADRGAPVIFGIADVIADGGAKAFIFHRGIPARMSIDPFHVRKMLVGVVCSKISHAIRAIENGADFIIAQGSEGSGFTGEIFTSVLLPQVVDAVAGKAPVIAAGGYFDGRGLASALCYGAQGVFVGMRFMLTPEANISQLHKEKLLRASENDTIVTKCYTGTPLRVLRNEYTKKFEDNPKLLKPLNVPNKFAPEMFEGKGLELDVEDRPYIAGQSIGAIKTLKPAGEIVHEMMDVAAAILLEVFSKFTKEDGTVSTPLCNLLGTKYCIMSAGMGGIAGKDMTLAVSKAGGFGTFGGALHVANLDADELLEQIKDINQMCGGAPFGVDILVHGKDGGVMPELIEAFSKGGARAFISGKGHPNMTSVNAFHERNILVGSICGKVSHAELAVKAGVDFVIVQGSEGGGHTGEVGLSVLLPLVVDAIGGKVPVIAAGGIYDGRGIASALCFGAQGVWIGTRFMMSPEAQTSEKYKAKLLKASSDDTCVTKCYTGSTMRVIRNPYVTKYEQNPALLEPDTALIAHRARKDGVWELHSGSSEEYDESNQALVTGQNVGAISTLKPCTDIVRNLNNEAWNVIQNVTKQVRYMRNAKL